MDGTARSNPYLPGRPTRWCVTADTAALPRAVVCRMTGEVDIDTAPRMALALDGALRRTRPAQELQAELSGVALFTAAGLTVLLRLREAAAARRVPLVLVAPSRTVRRVLELTGTGPLFTIRPALRPFARSGRGHRAPLT